MDGPDRIVAIYFGVVMLAFEGMILLSVREALPRARVNQLQVVIQFGVIMTIVFVAGLLEPFRSPPAAWLLFLIGTHLGLLISLNRFVGWVPRGKTAVFLLDGERPPVFKSHGLRRIPLGTTEVYLLEETKVLVNARRVREVGRMSLRFRIQGRFIAPMTPPLAAELQDGDYGGTVEWTIVDHFDSVIDALSDLDLVSDPALLVATIRERLLERLAPYGLREVNGSLCVRMARRTITHGAWRRETHDGIPVCVRDFSGRLEVTHPVSVV